MTNAAKANTTDIMLGILDIDRYMIHVTHLLIRKHSVKNSPWWLYADASFRHWITDPVVFSYPCDQLIFPFVKVSVDYQHHRVLIYPSDETLPVSCVPPKGLEQ